MPYGTLISRELFHFITPKNNPPALATGGLLRFINFIRTNNNWINSLVAYLAHPHLMVTSIETLLDHSTPTLGALSRETRFVNLHSYLV